MQDIYTGSQKHDQMKDLGSYSHLVSQNNHHVLGVEELTLHDVKAGISVGYMRDSKKAGLSFNSAELFKEEAMNCFDHF